MQEDIAPGFFQANTFLHPRDMLNFLGVFPGLYGVINPCLRKHFLDQFYSSENILKKDALLHGSEEFPNHFDMQTLEITARIAQLSHSKNRPKAFQDFFLLQNLEKVQCNYYF